MYKTNNNKNAKKSFKNVIACLMKSLGHLNDDLQDVASVAESNLASLNMAPYTNDINDKCKNFASFLSNNFLRKVMRNEISISEQVSSFTCLKFGLHTLLTDHIS